MKVKLDLKDALDAAKQASLEAGKTIMEIYNSGDRGYQTKDDDRKSELTKADTSANEVIVKRLSKRYPDIPILTEEANDPKERLDSEYVWIVDPMDGTKEFISRNGEFTVNIGLVKDGVPVLGALYIPAKNILYYAIEGQGAYMIENSKETKIRPSKNSDVNQMVLVKSRSHSGEKEKALIERCKFKDIITSGSSLKGCLVASGKADLYFRFGPTKEWDICAMSAIIGEAGAMITDLEGREIRFNKEDILINGFLVSNNTIHEDLIRISKQIGEDK